MNLRKQELTQRWSVEALPTRLAAVGQFLIRGAAELGLGQVPGERQHLRRETVVSVCAVNDP